MVNLVVSIFQRRRKLSSVVGRWGGGAEGLSEFFIILWYQKLQQPNTSHNHHSVIKLLSSIVQHLAYIIEL